MYDFSTKSDKETCSNNEDQTKLSLISQRYSYNIDIKIKIYNILNIT